MRSWIQGCRIDAPRGIAWCGRVECQCGRTLDAQFRATSCSNLQESEVDLFAHDRGGGVDVHREHAVFGDKRHRCRIQFDTDAEIEVESADERHIRRQVDAQQFREGPEIEADGLVDVTVDVKIQYELNIGGVARHPEFVRDNE